MPTTSHPHGHASRQTGCPADGFTGAADTDPNVGGAAQDRVLANRTRHAAAPFLLCDLILIIILVIVPGLALFLPNLMGA